MTCNRAILCLFSILGLTFNGTAHASDYSSTLQGPIGLNTIPSARMDPAGTIRIGTGTLDPYLHGYAGIQLIEPLHINIRQSAEVSKINQDPDRLYPGADIKLRVLRENRTLPEIAIGLQSAIGHKRMAGEYIALSKRHKNLDFTAGLGWGRLGSAGHFDNPLKGLFTHFGKPRSLDGEAPNEPEDWFTGEEIGIFGGIEYFTPVKGLSVKLDYGADRYLAEKAALNFNAPAPWSAGLAYQPTDWASFGLAMQGTDKLMGHISLKTQLKKWRDKSAQDNPAWPMRPYRTGLTLPVNMKQSAQRENLMLENTTADLLSARTQLTLNTHNSTPAQIGRAIPHIANHAGPAIEEITIAPVLLGLQGPSIRILRRDFEQAITRHQGSPEEIWHNTEFGSVKKTILKRPNRNFEFTEQITDATISLKNEFSLAEEDHGTLYRTSLIAGLRGPKLFGLLDSGTSIRLNIKDNLENLKKFRPTAILPVRSDVDQFAKQTFAVDTLYSAFTHSIRDDLHISLIGGYLEEMYGGYGGEILYRPFRSRFALGAEGWIAAKRDPNTQLNLGFNGTRVATGHLNAWYDIPYHDLTLKAQIGNYLAGDAGASIELGKSFKNGAKIKGFVTVTNNADFDLFGGTTHAYNGLSLQFPLGGFKHIPKGANIPFKAAQLGRETGQSLEKPLSLYDLTNQFSYNHMATYWDQIIPRQKTAQ